MAVVLEHFETAFTPGYHYRFTEIANAEAWRKWYSGDYATLLPNTPTVANGLKLLPNGVWNYPYFSETSDFIADAAMSEHPALESPDEALSAWLADNGEGVMKAIRRATHYWSIDGVGVLAAQADKIEAIDPIHYFRVGTVDMPDELVGHILALRYVEKTPAQQLLPEQNLPFNRLKVIKLAAGMDTATEQIMEYHPGIVGRPLTGVYESPVKSICVAGNWRSWYPGCKDIVAQLLITMGVQGSQLNRYANRIRWLPLPAFDDYRRDLGSENRPATFSEAMRAFSEEAYPYVGLSGIAEPPQEAIYVEDFASRDAYINTLSQVFALACGIPPGTFGVGISPDASGFAREKAQDAASARIRSYRHEVERCAPKAIKAMGGPEGELIFNWSSPPFQSRDAFVKDVLDMKREGIISVKETRAALGYSTTDAAMEALESEGQQAQEQQQQASTMRGEQQPQSNQQGGMNNAG